MPIIFAAILMLSQAAKPADPPKPTVESLQARVSQLDKEIAKSKTDFAALQKQIEQLQKQLRVEMSICTGAIDGARRAAMETK